MEEFDESLGLTCAMEYGSVVAYVMDSGGMVLGRSLCEQLQSNGWVEDLAAEQGIVGAQVSASAAAAAVAATASAAASYAQAVNDARTTAAKDLQYLASDSDFSAALKEIQSDVSQTASDLSQERSDAANGPGDLCENATVTVEEDAAVTIEEDEQVSLAQDVSQIGQALSGVSQEETAVEADLAALKSFGIPAPSGSSADLAAAKGAVSQAVSQVNSAIDTEAGYVKTAYQIANGMDTGPCSGSSGPGDPPTPPAHL